ncbi:MAG: ATP-binding protein [Candidatus Acidiferrales bacterium]
MTGNGTDQTQDRLTLRSRLSDMAQLPTWIEGLASRYAIPDDAQFAMNLCLEEVVSNVIRHGYGPEADRPVTVRFTTPREGYCVIVVEDEAPRFNPLDAPELPALGPGEEFRVGGQGIRLLRRFAETLEYEPTANGNRLRMGFSTAGSAARTRS